MIISALSHSIYWSGYSIYCSNCNLTNFEREQEVLNSRSRLWFKSNSPAFFFFFLVFLFKFLQFNSKFASLDRINDISLL